MHNIHPSVKTFIAALAELTKELDPSLQKEVNEVASYLLDKPDLAQDKLARLSKQSSDLHRHYQLAGEAFADFYLPQAKDKVIYPEETGESAFHDEYNEITNISGFPEDIIQYIPVKERAEESMVITILESDNSVEAAKKAKKTLIPKEKLAEKQIYIWAHIYLR